MQAIVVGCGRVGSALAKKLAAADWQVAVVDSDETALELLPDDWRHPFVVGHALDTNVLEEAGIRDADVLVAATAGDNTNVVVAQVAKLRYEVERVAVRIHDPGRADFYGDRGLELVSPTRTAIRELTTWALAQDGGGS
ncbi:MAG TPA: NAD-binding protein [Gaiellaceae bacterium]|jgi:trk system potassium uptake protein TrkA